MIARIIAKKWFISAIGFLIIASVIGVMIGITIDGFLAIRLESKDLPEVEDYQANMHSISLPIVDNVTNIIIPSIFIDNDLYNRSVATLANVFENATGILPTIYSDLESIPNGTTITIGDSSRNSFVYSGFTFPSDFDNSSFALRSYNTPNHTILAIIGGSKIGDTYGVYWLADEMLTGTNLGGLDIFNQNATIIPDMKYRLVEHGGVGMLPDTEGWVVDDYSLNNRDFEDVFLLDSPYINATAFARVEQEFKEYIHLMISHGYNYIVMDGFLEYVNFDLVGTGEDIYGANSSYRARQLVHRSTFGSLYEYAYDLGMKVILITDMVALTEPLKNYFLERFEAIDSTNDDFWTVYKLGLQELFSEMPYVEGLMVRIGEAGAAYNIATQLYRSELYVKTVTSVQKMLNAFIDVVEAFDKTLIFRTWSVGVGEVGDMHTNPESYDAVLGTINSDNLIVSTKYSMGDFYSYLPFNPTLLSGDHKRIIEFQARREFEGFNAFPNYIGNLYQAALQYASQNENLEGIWLWPQYGGPMRAGPMSIYPFHGFWLYIDANVYATSKIAWDINASLVSVTEGWISKNFGTNPSVVNKLTNLLLLSRKAVEQGLYIKEFADETVYAFGLEPPPMLWIFEWDRVSGVTSVMSGIYLTCRPHLEDVIQGGFDALTTVQQMKSLLTGLEVNITLGSQWFDDIVESLNYEESLYETLAWYRSYSLNYYHWLDTGKRSSYREWNAALETFTETRDQHILDYDDDLDFPAYYFEESDAGIKFNNRNVVMSWIARIFLVLILAMFVLGSNPIHKRLPKYPGKGSFRLLFVSLFMPWKIEEEESDRIDLIFLVIINYGAILLGFAFFTSFVAGYATLGIAILLTIRVIASIFLYRADEKITHTNSLLSTSSPYIFLMLFMSIIMSVRGPGYFWFIFWILPGFRIAFLSIFVVLSLWWVFVIYAIAQKTTQNNPTTIIGRIQIQIGLWWGTLGALLGMFTLETALTALNKELLLVPFALSDILGITVHLNIPQNLPIIIIIFGAILIVTGIITISIYLIERKTKQKNETFQKKNVV